MTGSSAQVTDHDREYIHQILPGVSRTFALTIPELPQPLRDVVATAYLLCRVADTIEDEPALSPERRRYFHDRLCAALAGESDQDFGAELAAQLSTHSLPAERELVRNTARIVRVSQVFPSRQLAAVRRCLGVMSRGMHYYECNRSPAGLSNMSELDRYCYHVAGVVGEMLTELFCDYSEEIDGNRQALLQHAICFGQGLQMTNVIADTWEDLRQSVCWLPRDVFDSVGFDLAELVSRGGDRRFQEGLMELVGVAHAHLRYALTYTLTIPSGETGIRRFLLWAIGLAVMTLRKIASNPGFESRAEVKVSRRTVRAIVLATSAAVRSNAALSLLFELAARPLPLADPEAVRCGPQAA